MAKRVTSPYVKSPPAGAVPLPYATAPQHLPPPRDPGIQYSPTAPPTAATEVRDRARTYIPARSRSRESLNKSRDMSRSREYISRSRDNLDDSRRSVSSYQPSTNSRSYSTTSARDYPDQGQGHTGVKTPSFTTALQMTEAAEVRERGQNSRTRRNIRKESSRSVYDATTTNYEASV